MPEISKRIRKIRKLNKLSQLTFAERLGVNRSHISKIETGAANPSGQLIKLICNIFGIREEWLKEGEEPIDENSYTPEIIRKFQADIKDMECEKLLLRAKLFNQVILDATKAVKEYERRMNDEDSFTIPASHPKFIELQEEIRSFENNLFELRSLLSSHWLLSYKKNNNKP